MSDEPLERIENKLARINHKIDGLATGQDDLRREVQLLHEDAIGRIDHLANGQDDLRRQMLVLHKESD
jgi:hypothetical protein